MNASSRAALLALLPLAAACKKTPVPEAIAPTASISIICGGTSACIAGWAAVIGQRQLKADGWQYVHVEYQAAHLMGLTYSVAYELFHKSSDLWSQIQKPTAAQAAWVLRYLATNGRLPSAGLIPS